MLAQTPDYNVLVEAYGFGGAPAAEPRIAEAMETAASSRAADLERVIP